MFDAKAWEIEIRSAITGESVWHRCIAIGVAMTNQGPMPITLYQDDNSKLAIAAGSPKLRLSEVGDLVRYCKANNIDPTRGGVKPEEI